MDVFKKIKTIGNFPSGIHFCKMFVFKGVMYIMAGLNQTSGDEGSLYWSHDGIRWNKRTEMLDSDGNTILARSDGGVCVHDNRVYLIGGYNTNTTTYLRDVYVTTDMVVWTKLADAPWVAKGGFTTLSFGGRLWVIGGNSGTATNEVWSTKEGVEWRRETDLPLGNIYDTTGVVFDNRMFIFGGNINGVTQSSDVWSTVDGVNWVKIDSNSGFSARYSHQAVVFNGKVILVGGVNFNGVDIVYYKNMYQNTGDCNWKEVAQALSTDVLFGFGLCVFNERLFLLDNSCDLWESNTRMFKVSD